MHSSLCPQVTPTHMHCVKAGKLRTWKALCCPLEEFLARMFPIKNINLRETLSIQHAEENHETNNQIGFPHG